jgi:(2Fe-2S) ferredoxin
MSRYERHVFTCVNRREPGNPKGCCAEKGGELVAERFKAGLHQRGLKGRMRANKAGCLDHCALGVSVVVYPEGVWYCKVTPDDVDEIIDKHMIGGQVVTRLLSPVTKA